MHRFGYGAATDDIVAARSPETWIATQLDGSIVLPEDLPRAATYLRWRAELGSMGGRSSTETRRAELQQEDRKWNKALIAARENLASRGNAPVIERLVHFWANHFAVSAARRGLGHCALAYEFEAIRPQVLSSFPELLISAIAHPSMLIYLDNDRSIGPRSRRGGDINENLAREVLELHTIGLEGGVRQRDVEELALGLTGWRWAWVDAADPGEFQFDPNRHQPGPRTLLGRRYESAGRAQGDAMLYDLALHPATADRLVGKLALHFLGAEAPAAVQEAAIRTFLDTGGDLRATYRALFLDDYGFEARLTHFKTPQQFWYSSVRTLGVAVPPRDAEAALVYMAQPLGKPPSPAGWPEERDSYGGGAAFRERLRIAAELAEDSRALRWVELLDGAYGPLASSATRQVLRNAESPRQAGALFLMSPEFQSR